MPRSLTEFSSLLSVTLKRELCLEYAKPLRPLYSVLLLPGFLFLYCANPWRDTFDQVLANSLC